jgi:hypothetical protein
MKAPRKTPAPPRSAARKSSNGPDVFPRLDHPIRVMISSRNRDEVPTSNGEKVSLLEVRRQLKAELEGKAFCDQQILDVWINEDAGGESGNDSIWDVCRQEMERDQIIIALVNGEAGWCRESSGLGICHEEIKYAFDHFPSRLYPIRIGRSSEETPANQAFERFLTDIHRWEEPVSNAEELIAAVKLAVAKAVARLTITGSRTRKASFSFGTPLAWSRLGYPERKARIEAAAVGYLLKSCARELPGAKGAPNLVWKMGGAEILLRLHGVPSSFGIAEAREMVGRPYLSDHLTLAAISGGGLLGPVHVIACHKTCAESRIFAFLGHPDVYIVKTGFGFFAVDLSSFVQAFFLIECRDEDSTVMALEQMFEWIAVAGEEEAIVDRARSRQRILAAVRAEVDALTGARPAGAGRGALSLPTALGFGNLPAEPF